MEDRLEFYYQRQADVFRVWEKRPTHYPPHMHQSFECILITDGSMELGVGMNYYHMEKGDFAIVFPGLVHHYQVFDPEHSKAIFLNGGLESAGIWRDHILQDCPKDPVIHYEKIHEDIPYAMCRILELPQDGTGQETAAPDEQNSRVSLRAAFMQILLSRAMICYTLVRKEEVGSDDIVYKVISYIAEHFREPLSLTGMAEALGYSPFTLSRVFSRVFHSNFSRYLNHTRLNDVLEQFREGSSLSITEICFNAGFESQRTFNRAFEERFHMSPREYRKSLHDSKGKTE